MNRKKRSYDEGASERTVRNSRITRKRRKESSMQIKPVAESQEHSEDDIIEDSTDDESAQPNPRALQKPYQQSSLGSRETSLPTKVPLSEGNELGEALFASPDAWVDKYTPQTTSAVCINPSKLKQVREAISAMLKPDSSVRMLVLTGPAGSSKSTCIKVLANELVKKHIAGHAGHDLSLSGKGDCFIEYIDSPVSNQPSQFSEFLQDCKYRVGANMCVVLIEELPNVFHMETLSRFREALKEWIHCGETLPPLVLCLTEIEYTAENSYNTYNIENNLCVDTLLGKAISSAHEVRQIKFNAIANKFMTKTVGELVRNEKDIFKKIPKRVLNSFVDDINKSGDIRSAVSNLQWWATSYKCNEETKSKKDCDSSYNLSQDGFEVRLDIEKILPTNFRESQINLFHAIGKIIYSSSEFDNMNGEDSDYYSVEKVLQSFNHSNFGLLNLAILENYHSYNESEYSLEIASEIVDGLSLSDLLFESDNSREIGIKQARLKLRSVGLETSRKATATSKSIHARVKFPRHYKMIRQFNSTKLMIHNYQRFIDHRNSFDDLNLIYGYFLPIILNKGPRKRYMYNRLGGSFKAIFADDSLPSAEEENIYTPMDQFQIDILERIREINREEVNEGSDSELSDPIDDVDNCGESEEDEFEDWSDPELDLLISQGKL